MTGLYGIVSLKMFTEGWRICSLGCADDVHGNTDLSSYRTGNDEHTHTHMRTRHDMAPSVRDRKIKKRTGQCNTLLRKIM